jgi:hypothetical protein
MSGKTALWALAAVLGIALAAGISFATSQLTSQHIGLGSEPLTAGRRLAPPPAPTVRRTTTPAHTRPPTGTAPQAPATTQPQTAAPPSVTLAPGAGEGASPPVASPPGPAGEAGAEQPARETSGDDQSPHSRPARQGRDD